MSKQAADLAKQLAALLAQTEQPANDDEPIDEAAIDELVRKDAEWMRRAKKG